MKRMKISPLLTLSIAFQMIVSPLAQAQGALQIVQGIGQLVQQNQQRALALRNAQANQQILGQLTEPGPDKHFRGDLFSRIPGFNDYVSKLPAPGVSMSCLTLPTTLTEIRAEVCRIGVTNDRGVAPQAQLEEMRDLWKTYGDVSKAYDNYRQSTGGVDRQAFGVGCMKNAMEALNGFLSTRITDLDNLMAKIGVMHESFKRQSEADLRLIEENTALLEGGDSELAAEVRSRNAAAFEFGKFFDNPACKSMYQGTAIKDLGDRGGFNRLSRDMDSKFSAQENGSKFSGASYIGAHNDVLQDINKMAKSAAEQFRLNFQRITSGEGGFSQFLSGLPNAVGSTNGLTQSFRADFFADVQEKFNKQNEDIINDRSVLMDDLREAGGNPDSVMNLANNLNARNFDNEVRKVELQIKNNCVQRSLSGEGFWDRVRKNIQDRDASKQANKNPVNPLRDEIQRIMEDPLTTPETKIAEVRRLEMLEGGRYRLRSATYQKTSIANGKAQRTTENCVNCLPSKYFSDIVSSCKSEFEDPTIGARTGFGAIQRIRDLNTKYRSLATSQMNSISNEIRNKLINCENGTEANNTQEGSCNSNRFNTRAEGFCASAAFTCANNMKSCSSQAAAKVKELKDNRDVSVKRYKANLEVNKNQIKAKVVELMNGYSAIGNSIAALNLGATFATPTPEFNIQGEGRFQDKFRAATANSPDGALLIEDPDKYIELMKTNVDRLKASIEKTQRELTGRGGVLAQHIEQTERNYAAAKAKADEIANNCIQKHDDYVRQSEQQLAQQRAEQLKRTTELGQKRDDICALFTRAQFDANGACNEKVKDITAPVAAIYGEFQGWCAETGLNNQAEQSSGNTLDICRKVKASSSASKELKQTCTDYEALKRKPGGCTGATEITGSDGVKKTVATDLCEGMEEVISSDFRGEKISVASTKGPPTPADCNSGFNGDRNGAGRNTLDFVREAVAGGSAVQGF